MLAFVFSLCIICLGINVLKLSVHRLFYSLKMILSLAAATSPFPLRAKEYSVFARLVSGPCDAGLRQ